jgi:hypothetical protein
MSTTPDTTAKDKATAEDVGQKELQAARDAVEKQGFIGESPSPFPDDDYTQKTGPTSPTAHDHHGPRRR